MMVLDLQSFDTVEVVGFNELFKLVPNPFPNSNSFRNPDSFENTGSLVNPDSFVNHDKFENLEILCSRLDLILGSRTPLLKTEKILQFWDKKCKINVHD